MKGFARLLVLFGCLLGAASASAWWNDDWAFRKKIAFDTSADGIPTEARVTEAPVLVRLTIANFPYFMDLAPDGSDIRFVASDDATPLRFHIETLDAVAGVANIWVRVPALNPGLAGDGADFVYMYYGNPESVSASDPAATWDTETTLVMHLDEMSGLPKDATAFGHQAIQSTAAQGVSGQIDAAIGLSASSRVRLAESPALGVTEDGATLSLWIRPDGVQPVGNIVEIAAPDGQRFALEARDGFLVGTAGAPDQAVEVRAPTALSERRWQHAALSLGRELVLYLDGTAVARQPAAVAPFSGTVTLGATDVLPGFAGAVDELQVSRGPRSADWIRLAASGQGADSKLLALGEDESRESGNQTLHLIYTLLNGVDMLGWVINAVLVVIALIAFDVLISKGFGIVRTRREDEAFLAAFDEGFRRAGGRVAEVEVGDTAAFAHSALHPLFEAGRKELTALLDTLSSGGRVSLEALEVVRSSLDTAIVDGTNALNARLVYVTIAIAGGPFLGLLGTVVGVMMTFAAIASEGDVNVRTIAPGVAAALTTTVMGLLVAIPSLFGYNYVATLVSARTSAMEVFADQFLSRTALAYSGIAAKDPEASRAA